MEMMDGLTCCVCGGDAGRFKQHWNRDTGYGICRGCVDWLVNERRMPPQEMNRLYGLEGVNYEAKRALVQPFPPPEGAPN